VSIGLDQVGITFDAPGQLQLFNPELFEGYILDYDNTGLLNVEQFNTEGSASFDNSDNHFQFQHTFASSQEQPEFPHPQLELFIDREVFSQFDVGSLFQVSVQIGEEFSGDFGFQLDPQSLTDPLSTDVFLDPNSIYPLEDLAGDDTVDGDNGIASIVGQFPDGDFDASGIVEIDDLNLALFFWSQPEFQLPAEWTHMRPSDLATVGLEELNKVLFTWGQTTEFPNSVPEPEAIGLMVLGLSRLLSRHPRSTVPDLS
jgi:hypothetical protein